MISIDGQVSVLRSYCMKPFVSIKITTQNLPWLSIGSIFFWIRKVKGHQRQPSQPQLLLLAQLRYKVWLGVVPMCVLYIL